MIAAALLIATTPRAPAGCVLMAATPPHRISCPRARRDLPAPIAGPARLCGRHFAVALRPGDRLVSTGSVFERQHTITDRHGRTLRFGDEAFAPDVARAAPDGSGRSRWRADLQPSRYAGASGAPYVLHEPRGRYVLPSVDGTLLAGGPRDAAPLARLSARTPATRCDRAVDLGTIGYSDDPDFSTMATR